MHESVAHIVYRQINSSLSQWSIRVFLISDICPDCGQMQLMCYEYLDQQAKEDMDGTQIVSVILVADRV